MAASRGRMYDTARRRERVTYARNRRTVEYKIYTCMYICICINRLLLYIKENCKQSERKSPYSLIASFSRAREYRCVCVYDAYKYIQYTHTYIILYTEGCNKALKKKNGGGSERASVCARTRKMKLRGKGIQHSGDNV